jgi:branched-chain amino acid transport system substrate-binding protein
MKKMMGMTLMFVLFLSFSAHGAEVFRLGLIYDGTGSLATHGRQGKWACDWAVEEINSKGGIQGRKIEVFAENAATDTQKASTAAYKVITKDQVHFIVGPTSSSNSSVIQQITERSKIPYVATVGSADILTEGKKEWFFRCSLAARFQSEDLINYCLNVLKAKTFALLAATSAHGQSLMENFTEILTKKGLKQSLLVVERFKDKDMDFSSQLLKVKAASPDILAIYGFSTEAARMVTQARAMGIKSRVVGGTGLDEEYGRLAESAGVGTIVSYGFWPKVPIPKVKNFIKEFHKRTGVDQPNFAGPQTYDILHAFADLMNKNPNAPKLSLKDDKLESDRLAIRDAIATIKKYDGISGNISFCKDPTPDCRDGIKDSILLQFKEGGQLVKLQ